jgi:hypothetical protein
MSSVLFRNYAALFFTSLAAFLGALFMISFFHHVTTKPVIVAFGPFEIYDDTRVVRPGGIVCYKIHYKKRLDIPGDITKQLILTLPSGDEMYVPLLDTAGHLPVGDVQKKSCVKLPDWIPEGIGRIKLSASYHLGDKPPSYNVAYTKEFEIRK